MTRAERLLLPILLAIWVVGVAMVEALPGGIFNPGAQQFYHGEVDR